MVCYKVDRSLHSLLRRLMPLNVFPFKFGILWYRLRPTSLILGLEARRTKLKVKGHKLQKLSQELPAMHQCRTVKSRPNVEAPE